MSDKVKLHYEASSNISFHGEYELDMTREEWDALTEDERDQIVLEVLSELVTIGVDES